MLNTEAATGSQCAPTANFLWPFPTPDGQLPDQPRLGGHPVNPLANQPPMVTHPGPQLGGLASQPPVVPPPSQPASQYALIASQAKGPDQCTNSCTRPLALK